MRTFTTDNRYASGAVGVTVPDDAVAAYAARWIDHGTYGDILGDRQGLAYDTIEQREVLLKLLGEEQPHMRINAVPRDMGHLLIDKPSFKVWVRRTGGYVYVEAWTVMQPPSVVERVAKDDPVVPLSMAGQFKDTGSAIRVALELGYTVWIDETHHDAINRGFVAQDAGGLGVVLHRVNTWYEWKVAR